MFKQKTNFITLSLIILVMMLMSSPDITAAQSEDTFDHEHFLLTEILSEYVSNGKVNYRALKTNQGGLNKYLQELADIDPEDFKNWTRQQQLAMWINAYNAYTIRAVLDSYPIEHSWVSDPLGQFPDSSIRQITGVWDIMTWTVMGKQLSLNKMEHGIMRQELIDPRIHYVLVCASIGCPKLENSAFDAANLEERLDQAGVNYIYDSNRIRIDKRHKVVGLPQIYKWFKEDFDEGTEYKDLLKNQPSDLSGLLSWVYKYANEQDRKFLVNGTYQISYLFYDWGLNESR